jgi:hypothetical protein
MPQTGQSHQSLSVDHLQRDLLITDFLALPHHQAEIVKGVAN